MERYVHQEPGAEVTSISGHYTILEEKRGEFKGRQFLYAIGGAVVDSSCCGAGGCRFIYVPGYIVGWKVRENDAGLPISEIEPIFDGGAQRQIEKLLGEQYPNSQIIFLPA